MVRKLAGTVLVAAAVTALTVAPAAASTGASSAASAQLIRTKVYFGDCENTCQIKVRISNISRTNIFDIRLKARLKINGRTVGNCTDHAGSLKAKRTKWAACTVRSKTLARAYDRYLDGFAAFDQQASTTVYYRYYR